MAARKTIKAGSGAKKVKSAAGARRATKSKSKVTAKSTATAKAKATAKKKPATKSAGKSATLAIRSIQPSRDGTQWIATLTDGSKRAAGASAAQSAGMKVGAAWSSAFERKLATIATDQASFLSAMELLATRGKMNRPSLEKALGGDARARRTVATLARNGWVQ